MTSIQTGMNFWNGQNWVASNPSFQVSADGTSFVASQVQDPTTLAANLNTEGAVTATTPDNVTLRSTPVAIGLYDAASGKSVVLAAITNTIGVLVDPQHVVYRDAFVGGGLAASVVYSFPDVGSFHQDVVFTGFDPNFNPAAYGFSADAGNTLQIQIMTEFYNPPQPQMMANPLYIEQDANKRASMESPDIVDYAIDFGDYTFAVGRAYTTSTISNSVNGGIDGMVAGVRIAKDFVSSSGRTFLVENIPFTSIESQLQALPPVKISALKPQRRAQKMKVAAASLPPLRLNQKGSIEKIAPAKASSVAMTRPQGVVADYIVTVSPSAPTYYSSDTTYFVAGNVYLTSPVTIESTVFKYPTNVGSLVLESTLTLATTNYRPATFAAADDNTVGATLSTRACT
jgi:hypothetical protein